MLRLTKHNYRDILDTVSMPIDMQDTLRRLFRDLDSQDWQIEYDAVFPNNWEATHYLFVPQSNRGAVCEGGMSIWGDAHDMEDLKHRWANHETMWVE